MSSYKVGREKELRYSKEKHLSGTPLLIEPAILRRRGAGQVDLAVIEVDKLFGENVCIIYEVKSFAFLGAKQRKRLHKSAELICSLLDMSCRISVIYDDF